jgi:SIR2-like protein/TIR domain-containing protein
MNVSSNPPTRAEGSSPAGPRAPSVFISYRRSDASAAGRQLSGALKDRFGDENVFFDVEDLDLGTQWQTEITRRIREADVVLAVIGPRWVSLADERGRRLVLDSRDEDVLRIEIETALRDGALVVPVLVDDASMPIRETLPRPFRPLTDLEAATLRNTSWDQDVEDLLEDLERRTEARRREQEPAKAPAPPPATEQIPPRSNAPDPDHYDDVADYLADGSLVAVLGPGVNTVRGSELPEEASAFPPDAEELARQLAARFDVPSEQADLARISQHIFLTPGPADLHRALRDLLIRSDYQPGPVYRFLARVPARLRERGLERYPLIVTANYDTALERAFDAAREPFDLAVFMAAGEDKGRFFHIPWWDGSGQVPGPIRNPNAYVDFPIDEYGELSRTVIVKIHGGALHDAPREFRVKHNYCITENDYIEFLSRSPIQSLVPLQILEKLLESHFLFLGYGVRDWSLRVFLWRIWSEQAPGANSWAIQQTLDKVDRAFWEKLDVERYQAPLSAYVSELEKHLVGR